MPERRGNQGGDPGDDRQDDSARDDRAHERCISELGRAVARQEADERFVVVRHAMNVQQHTRHEEPAHDRGARDGSEREGDPAHVGPNGVSLAGQRGQPAAERTRLMVENWEG